MSKTTKILMCTTFIMACVALTATSALAKNHKVSNDFTSHSIVTQESYSDYAENLPAHAKFELRNYITYQMNREPCPNFLAVPTGFTRVGCDLVPDKASLQKTKKHKYRHTHKERSLKLSPVYQTYEVHFDLNSSALTPEARDTLESVSKDVKKKRPKHIILSGFTDTSGPASYNIGLSEQRVDSVSGYLNDMGIKSRKLKEKAFGEDNLAVKTKDGVTLEENRRVLIELR